MLPKKEHVQFLEIMAKNGALSTLTEAPILPRSYMQALFHYKDQKVRDLVWQIKYAGNSFLTEAVAKLLSEEIVSFFDDQSNFIDHNWLLVPIPTSKKHLKEKGFNQTENLAKAMMKHCDNKFITYAPNLLQKIQETEAQVTIKNKSKRLENLKNTYGTFSNELITGRNIFVIDDVITTGSTMGEARRALRSAGAKQIICLAIAH